MSGFSIKKKEKMALKNQMLLQVFSQTPPSLRATPSVACDGGVCEDNNTITKIQTGGVCENTSKTQLKHQLTTELQSINI